jgi:hypothetical protein
MDEISIANENGSAIIVEPLTGSSQIDTCSNENNPLVSKYLLFYCFYRKIEKLFFSFHFSNNNSLFGQKHT